MRRTRQPSASPSVQRQKKRRPAGRHVTVALLLSAAAALGGVLLYLWPQMRLVDLGYREHDLQVRRVQALQRQKELRVELSTLQQLPRIEMIAVQRLGLRPPQVSQVIYVRPEQHAMRIRSEP